MGQSAGVTTRSHTSEKLLWKKLRNEQLGVRVRRQHPIGPFIADFFVPSCNLVIELDGDSHLSQEQIDFDLRRTEYLELQGCKIVRLKNHQIKKNMEWVIDQLSKEITLVAVNPEDTLNPPKTTDRIEWRPV